MLSLLGVLYMHTFKKEPIISPYMKIRVVIGYLLVIRQFVKVYL